MFFLRITRDTIPHEVPFGLLRVSSIDAGFIPRFILFVVADAIRALFSTWFPPGSKGCSMGAERVIKGSSAQDHPNQTPRILLFHLLSLQRIGLVCIFNKYLVLFEYFACRLPRSRRCFYILCFTVARKRIEIVFSIVFYQ